MKQAHLVAFYYRFLFWSQKDSGMYFGFALLLVALLIGLSSSPEDFLLPDVCAVCSLRKGATVGEDIAMHMEKFKEKVHNLPCTFIEICKNQFECIINVLSYDFPFRLREEDKSPQVKCKRTVNSLLILPCAFLLMITGIIVGVVSICTFIKISLVYSVVYSPYFTLLMITFDKFKLKCSKTSCFYNVLCFFFVCIIFLALLAVCYLAAVLQFHCKNDRLHHSWFSFKC